MGLPPLRHVAPEVVQQRLWRTEPVVRFHIADVPMVAFAALVVVTHDADAIHHEGPPELEPGKLGSDENFRMKISGVISVQCTQKSPLDSGLMMANRAWSYGLVQ